MKKRKNIDLPVLVKCAECSDTFRSGKRLPLTRLAIEGVKHLSELEREDIFTCLAINLSSFCEYIEEKYKLESNKIQIEIEFEDKSDEKIVEA